MPIHIVGALRGAQAGGAVTRDEVARAAHDAWWADCPDVTWDGASADERERFARVADAIGPRCTNRWRTHDSYHGEWHDAQCTLPAWHDREVEKCR